MEDRTDNWEELVQSQENRLYRAALAILGSRQEAEDAVQDTFRSEEHTSELQSPILSRMPSSA